MKSLMMLALAVGSIAAAAPVAAEQVVVQRTTVVRHDVRHNDSGWHANRGHQKHRVCRTHWRNHHRVRNCFWR